MTSSTNPIITTSGKIDQEIYHVDVQARAVKKIVSSFIIETPDAVVLLDTGTSDDISKILRFMRKQGMSLQKVKYLVPSHYHFDHFGGGWKLWDVIKDHNPDVKVITTEKTRNQLQDSELHMQRAARTFGEFIGEMHPLPEEAFEIVDPGTSILVPGLELGEELVLVSTPGHTQDHCSPALMKDGRARFIYAAEAAGTLFNSSKLVTFGTSMPPEYNTETYIESLRKIIDLQPGIIGYCHFGVVKGRDATNVILQENMEYTYFFRDFVKQHYEESGSIRHVVEVYMQKEAPRRSNFIANDFLAKILVALVYGQLIDLGLKNPK